VSTQNTVGAPTRSTEVEQEVNALIRHEEDLAKTVVELEQRLFKVLVSVGPSNAEGSKSDQSEPVLVPLAEVLYDRNRNISSITNHLQSIINRIEL
jgi:hypothetical protein